MESHKDREKKSGNKTNNIKKVKKFAWGLTLLQHSKTPRVSELRTKEKVEPYPGRTKKEKLQICYQFLLFQAFP